MKAILITFALTVIASAAQATPVYYTCTGFNSAASASNEIVQFTHAEGKFGDEYQKINSLEAFDITGGTTCADGTSPKIEVTTTETGSVEKTIYLREYTVSCSADEVPLQDFIMTCLAE